MKTYTIKCRDCTHTTSLTTHDKRLADAEADEHIRTIHHGSGEADVTPETHRATLPPHTGPRMVVA